MGLHVLGWSPLSVKLVSALWFASENWLEMAVLSQVNQMVVVKHNKAFKSDSQRLAFSLRSSIAKRRSHLNAALCLIT
ncbi:hypothetical protein Q7142_004577 [Vibrio parahaemolyticus]|nr:hypothetical protein [Vibrio parahaemolyticus]